MSTHPITAPNGAGGGGVPLLLSERDVEAWFGLKARTLQRWRLRGKGPVWVKLHGLIRYKTADVLTWIDAADSGGGGK